jgi:hypothetical protein
MFIFLYILMILTFLAFIGIYKLAKTGRRAVPIDDIAVFTVLCICLYTLLPVISWLLQGGEYIIPVGRLYQMQPTVSEVFELMLLGVGPIFGVLVVYFLQRATLARLNVKPLFKFNWWISNKLLFICATIVICVYAVQSAIKFKYGMLNAETYNDTYIQYANLPKIVAQLLAQSRAALSVSMLIVVAALVMRWDSGGKKWLIIMAALLLLTFDVGYSRTQLFYYILLFIVLYHMFVQPFTRAFKVLWLFLIVLVSFLLLGLRGDGLISFAALPLGEFDNIWANGVHLLRERVAGTLEVPINAHLNEFVNFIPSQLLPYQKIDMSNWYLDTYYPGYKENGGGLKFGVIPQAIVGFGLAESFFRGIIVGAISIKLKNILHKYHSCWSLIVFLMIYMSSYDMVRGGNFSAFIGLLGTTLLIVLVIRWLNRVLPSKQHPNILNVGKTLEL